MNIAFEIAKLSVSSFVFGAVVCIIFIFRPIVEGLIGREQNEVFIRCLEKLKLDTWIGYNRWAMVGTAGVFIIQVIQLLLGNSASLVKILVNCTLLGALIWNQVIDTKLLHLTDSAPTIAIVSDRGDKTWQLYHNQAPPLGGLLVLLSGAALAMQLF